MVERQATPEVFERRADGADRTQEAPAADGSGGWGGAVGATIVLLTLVWGSQVALPGPLVIPIVITVVLGVLLVLTWRSPGFKVALVRGLQRWFLNPCVRALHAIGLNPLGVVLLETTGRSSGLPRRVPVGNGRRGKDFWIVAEHGLRSNYVRNLQRDPRVRVLLRDGLRRRWVDGFATVLPGDDPLARQRMLVGGNPLRALNALTVRVLGAEPVTVHIRLDADGRRP